MTGDHDQLPFSRRRLAQGATALGFALAGEGLAALSGSQAVVLAQTPVAAAAAGAEAAAVATDAYLYFYPLVTMDVTRGQLTNVEPNTVPLRGPMNMFVSVREYPAANASEVVRPNFDTLYSSPSFPQGGRAACPLTPSASMRRPPPSGSSAAPRPTVRRTTRRCIAFRTGTP